MIEWGNVVERMLGAAPALLGAVAGGYFTLRAARQAARREANREIRQEEKEVQNLLDALGVELEALWGFHQRRVGALVANLPDGKPLEIYYPLTQDYFTIYNSNAAKIGSIKDEKLRTAIVVTYNKCKKVVDGFKYNNRLYENQKTQEMIDYAKLMKEDHFELKGYIEGLQELLRTRNK